MIGIRVSRELSKRSGDRIGKCSDCGELYAFRSSLWKLGQTYERVYCTRCGSELNLTRTTWGKRQSAIFLK